MFSGDFSANVDSTFLLIFWVSVILLVGITFTMVYFMIKYHHTRNKEPQDIHGHLGLEITWTVIPTILVLGMFYYGMIGYEQMSNIPEDAMVVETTGRMWSWAFKYENGVETDTLYVPANKPVHLKLKSQDVIHSFYIPKLRIKKDVVPGVSNQMWFSASEAGRYDVLCAEYCGDQHAYMYTRVIAMPQAAFDQWYEESGETVAPVSEESAPSPEEAAQALAKRGEMLYRTKGCVACHSTDGTRLVGPSFQGVYGKSEVVIADGQEREITADEEYLRRSILEPDAEKVKGFENMVMTKIELTDQEVNALIEFIKKQP